MKALLLSLTIVFGWVGGTSVLQAQDASPYPIDVRSSAFPGFALGSSETRFGALEFIGGFEMSARASEFGQLSGLRFVEPGKTFIGVADHGYWFFGEIARDGDKPVGVRDFRMQPILDASGAAMWKKASVDAEGLDIRDGVATVSFEREARVTEYRVGMDGAGVPLRNLDYVIPRNELRYNGGLETLVYSPATSPLKGARITIAEQSVDSDGNLFAAIIEGPRKGIFKVRRVGNFAVTDGAFLPDGDLLLLERRYTPPISVGMRIRRIPAAQLVPGKIIDGDVLIEADLSARIDNMEAMDVWERADGATIISLMSDDNQSFLQRSLYLEFRLAE